MAAKKGGISSWSCLRAACAGLDMDKIFFNNVLEPRGPFSRRATIIYQRLD
jgi:hypothetical protein